MSVMKTQWGRETMSVPFTCHDDIKYYITSVEGKADCEFNEETQQFNSSTCELDIHFRSKGNTYYYVTIELDEGLYDIDLDIIIELLRDEISDKWSDIERGNKILTTVLAERKQ